MPTFHAISPTVNLASPSMISFIFETISLRAANFRQPDDDDDDDDELEFNDASTLLGH